MICSECTVRRVVIRRTEIFFAVSLLSVFAALFPSCAGTGARQIADTGAAAPDAGRADGVSGADFPPSLRFAPAPLPGLRPAPGTGLVTRDQRDLGGTLAPEDRDRLSASFRDAYTEGLLRGLPLEGVLGGDMVHGWPAAAPLAWAQNWQGGEGAPNSWAVPSLVLAMRGLSRDRAFIVHGRILDAYGKSAGRGGANGVSGYGAPRGGEFFHEGGIAQRFDYGLMKSGAGGTSFIEEAPPSAMAEAPEMPGGNGEIRERFRSAWKAAVDRNYPPLPPDTDLVRIDFGPNPWIVAAGSETAGSETAITLRGIWYQVYAGGQALLLLADAPELPPYPRLLTAPWLNAFLAAPEKRLPGTESLDPLPPPDWPGGDGNLARALLEAIAVYGVPLSDSLPLAETAPAAGYCEAQRFSRGWMLDRSRTFAD